MRLTPRAEEVAEVVALLESDDYDSAAALAKDIIKKVAGFLWFRDWYVLVLKDQTGAFGPFASQAEAVALATKYRGTLVPSDPTLTSVLTVHGLGGTAEEREGGGFGFCSTEGCGHPAYAHSMAGSSRGHCVLAVCNCVLYLQAKPKPRARAPKKAVA